MNHFLLYFLSKNELHFLLVLENLLAFSYLDKFCFDTGQFSMIKLKLKDAELHLFSKHMDISSNEIMKVVFLAVGELFYERNITSVF